MYLSEGIVGELTVVPGVEQDIENWGVKNSQAQSTRKFFAAAPTNPVSPTYWGHMTFLPLHPVETK